MVNCLFTEGYFITFQAICAPVQAVLRPKSQSTSAQIKHLNDEVAALNGSCKREDSKIPASRATPIPRNLLKPDFTGTTEDILRIGR
jgi:hypothetical protein